VSFLRHITERMKTKTEAEKSTSAHAIGLSYSLLSCSPAELNYASLNESNIKNQIAQFNLHSLKALICSYIFSFHVIDKGSVYNLIPSGSRVIS
jgi:hypothetical protein